MSLVDSVRDFFFDVGTVAAKIMFFAVVPLARKVAPDDESFSFKPDIKRKLEAHGMLSDFYAGKISCSECNSKVTFDNLGGLKESRTRLEPVCDNPACSLRL